MGRESRRLALGGVSCALAVVTLLLGGLLPAATFCAPLLAMAVLLPVLEEYGSRPAAAAYGATAILALWLVPEPETALVYLFFGWYPILRPRIAALRFRACRVLCRLAVCSMDIFLLYGPALSLLGLPVTEEPGGRWLSALLVLLGNGTFLLLDLALSRLSVLWRVRLRRRFFPT